MAMYCAVTGMGDFAVKAKVLLFRGAVMSRVDYIGREMEEYFLFPKLGSISKTKIIIILIIIKK